MINSIPPEDFAAMLPIELKEECKRYGIPLTQQAAVCACLNNLRNEITETATLPPHRLASLDLRPARFTNLVTSRTFVIQFQKHNLQQMEMDWRVDFIAGVNYIKNIRGELTWYIRKEAGKVMPKAYKEFLKAKFQGANIPTINKLDMFYDYYIKTYNEIYQREMDNFNQQTECAEGI
mgnify:CR=1 FL=1